MSGVEPIIGATIREIREKRRISQTVLAGLVGVDRVHLARIEAGSRAPSLRTLIRLAIALRVPPADLLKRITPAVLRTIKLD